MYTQSGDQEWKEIAIKQADYFVNNLSTRNTWDYNFDFTVVKDTLKSPWSFAMATGQALSLLSRVYIETNDARYLEICKQSLKPLTISVDEGGFAADFFGYIWYEEYPTKTPNFTLNGLMFTLIGLHDYYEISGDEEALQLYKDGINTLKYALPFFDSDKISLYHLGHLFTKEYLLTINLTYHPIHVLQLGVIMQWEDSKEIEYYYEQWKAYMN